MVCVETDVYGYEFKNKLGGFFLLILIAEKLPRIQDSKG